MTFEEFQKQELDCEECPIRKSEFCPHSIGFDYDPPCSYANPDQDMGDWIKDKLEYNRKIEEREDKQIRKEKEKKQIACKRAETSQQMKIYCVTERQEVLRLKSAIKQLEKTICTAQCWAFAFNATNKMFGYDERKQVKPELKITLENIKEQLKIAEEKYKVKRKEFYAQRKIKKD